MPQLANKQTEPALCVSEVVDRAKAEFGFVHVDSERGLRFVANRILATNTSGTHDLLDDLLAPFTETIEMIAGDEPRSDQDFLKCYVIPGKPIEIEYVFDGHDVCCSPLMQRLARALNYDIVCE